jgi:hypothetical protein
MGFKFNPFTGNLDLVDTTTAAGSNTQVQFNDGGSLAGDSGLTFNKTTNALTVGASTVDGGQAKVFGDINLDDGGTFTTTIQCVTPTLTNKTISFPDATGTVALVAGSSGQLLWNNAGANAGASTLTYDGSILTTSGRFINSYNATASNPAKVFTGTWFTGGTATTTKPHFLVEPTGTTSTAWSTSGTGLGVNAASGFAGNLLDLQVNGTSRFSVSPGAGNGFVVTQANGTFGIDSNIGAWLRAGSAYQLSIDSAGVGFKAGTGAPSLYLVPEGNNLLAQRNGTNAQTFRVYNTYTNDSNYERGFLRWSSNVFEVGPEAAGTGTTRPMRITAATLKLPNLPTYADNAAATTGGLVAGDVYKTATGELRITV